MQLLPRDINIDFVGRRHKFWTLSAVLVVASIGVLIVNTFVRGSALNYGIDFKGGSQVQIEFDNAVEAGTIRGALESAGFSGAEVVKMDDPKRPHLFLLRLTEVSSFTPSEQKKAKELIEGAFAGQLRNFDYKTGSDKLYVSFSDTLKVDIASSGKATAKKIENVFAKGDLSIQQVELFGRAQDRTFEVTLGGLSGELRKVFEGKVAVKDIPQVESVGAKMGEQLRDDGIKSVVYALILMLVYIAVRFDFRYAPGAVAALAHDVISSRLGFLVLAGLSSRYPLLLRC